MLKLAVLARLALALRQLVLVLAARVLSAKWTDRLPEFQLPSAIQGRMGQPAEPRELAGLVARPKQKQRALAPGL